LAHRGSRADGDGAAAATRRRPPNIEQKQEDLMAYNLQDQEQIDELKAFWANNGNRLMWLAVIALAVFAGWRAWNWHHDSQAQDAAREYFV